MKKDSEAHRHHKAYLRAKSVLRDQHQDDYALMLERHAKELDDLWASYNLAVKKLANEHNKTIKSMNKASRSRTAVAKRVVRKVVPIKKEVRQIVSMENELMRVLNAESAEQEPDFASRRTATRGISQAHLN